MRYAFDTNNKIAKARIVEFMVKKGTAIYNYGIITELYAPDFRTPQVNETDKGTGKYFFISI